MCRRAWSRLLGLGAALRAGEFCVTAVAGANGARSGASREARVLSRPYKAVAKPDQFAQPFSRFAAEARAELPWV